MALSKNLNWYKLLSREGVDVTTTWQVDIVFYDLTRQATGEKGEVLFTRLKNRNLTHYICTDHIEVGRWIYKKFFNSSKQIIKYYEEGQRLLNGIKEDTTKWSRLLTKKPTNDNFISAFRNFRKSFVEISYIYSITSWLGIEAWQIDFENILKRLIGRNKLEKQTETILATVYKPWKKTALIEIQAKLAKGYSPRRLADEYQFLRSWCVIWYKPITEEWVKSIRIPTQKEKLKLYSSEKLLALLNPDTQEKTFIQIEPNIIFFKDWRDDVRRFHAYRWSFLFDLLGQKFNIHRDDIGYLTLDEIEKALQKEIIATKIISKRKKGCIITIAKKSLAMQVLDDKVPDKYSKIIYDVEQRGSGKRKIIRGKIAQTGIARGIIKIIRSYHDIKRVRVGDILVANTTHPDYLPAMQRAAAFVTNEGGIISHAAIVARELEVPCVIGTKVVTKVLKDGDLVEVDANRGIIKKIN